MPATSSAETGLSLKTYPMRKKSIRYNPQPVVFKPQQRAYRNWVQSNHLVSFAVKVKETDLLVHAAEPLEELTRELVLEQRAIIEWYVNQYPRFARALYPWHIAGPAPPIIQAMANAGEKAGVGPMAAVAGAVAEFVGRGLLPCTNEVIVENGGDVFLKTNDPTTVGLFAGKSPLSMRFGLRTPGGNAPIAICTSSGTVGHSLSLGKADAVCVVSSSGPLADAAATSIGNRVESKRDIQTAIDFGKAIEGVSGLVLVVEDEMGLWGELEIVPLDLKKG